MTDIDDYIEGSTNRNTFKEGPACPVDDCYNDGFLTDLSPLEGWPFECSIIAAFNSHGVPSASRASCQLHRSRSRRYSSAR